MKTYTIIFATFKNHNDHVTWEIQARDFPDALEQAKDLRKLAPDFLVESITQRTHERSCHGGRGHRSMGCQIPLHLLASGHRDPKRRHR